jgi:hypothetical protein
MKYPQQWANWIVFVETVGEDGASVGFSAGFIANPVA